MNVRYLAEAAADYEAAAAWYAEHSPDAADSFADAVEHAERIITDMPHTWPQWPRVRASIRRYLLPGFLYSIAYEVHRDEVVILAVAHQRRRPNFWHRRVIP